MIKKGEWFLSKAGTLGVLKHLGVLIARAMARTIPKSDLQGEAIIVDFKGPHSSSKVRDFAL